MGSVLGIAAYQFNPSASLVCDGELVAVCEEEKLLQDKRTQAFPARSILACLEMRGLSPRDIDAFVINHDPRAALSTAYLRYAFDRTMRKAVLDRCQYFFSFYARLRQDIRTHFPKEHGHILARLHYVQHHRAHAAGTYFLSPFENAAILTVDGGGESATAFYGHATGSRIHRIKEVHYPYSAGKFYSAITEYLGFRPNQSEGTVMGLSGYGTPEYENDFNKIFSATEGGDIRVDLKYFDYYVRQRRRFSQNFENKFGPSRMKEAPVTRQHMDIAYACQKSLEKTVIAMARFLKIKTSSPNLCLSGGTFLNCALNSAVRDAGIFDHIFIQPSVHDAGTSFGAALYWHHRQAPKASRTKLSSPYLGQDFSSDEILSCIKRSGVRFHRSENRAKETASLLAQRKIVGWFQGRTEIGPRALGNRSILAHPGDPTVKDNLNTHIKKREWFRPFAPAVLEDHSFGYFQPDFPSPYMLFAQTATQEARKKCPAIIHCDGTSRIQTVSQTSNPSFYELIQAFYRKTGLPLVLNTSLNTDGFPIANTPEDALKILIETPLEYLVMGSYVAYK